MKKVALITGSATGIGKRTAIELASQGCHVIINYNHSENEAKKLAQFIQNNYQVKTLCVQGDISVFEECKKIVNQSITYFNQIDILINNAGPYIKERKRMVEYSVDEWNYIISGNLHSVFYLSKLIIPLMRKQRWGRIINLGFDRAETSAGWMYRSSFAAAKVGLVSLTKSLSMEEASNGITVNMVCPGDIVDKWKEEDIENAYLTNDISVPVGREGTGEDIARTIVFLCGDKSDFITGSIVNVTGGKDVLNKNINNNIQ